MTYSRFDYSPEFLAWALKPPGYLKEWHTGVRVTKSNKLVGFISGVPANIRSDITDHYSSHSSSLFLGCMIRRRTLWRSIFFVFTRSSEPSV